MNLFPMHCVISVKCSLDCCRQTQAALSSLVAANEAMQSAVSGWSYCEQESVRALSGKYNGQTDNTLREGDNVQKMLGRASTFYAEKV